MDRRYLHVLDLEDGVRRLLRDHGGNAGMDDAIRDLDRSILDGPALARLERRGFIQAHRDGTYGLTAAGLAFMSDPPV
jgi:hypothetical protein